MSDNSKMLSYSPKKIVALRLACGLNQSELARKAGLSSPTIWALELGRTQLPKFTTLRDIAAALGVPLSAIMADEQPDDIDEQIKATSNGLSPANKAALLAAAKALLNSQQ